MLSASVVLLHDNATKYSKGNPRPYHFFSWEQLDQPPYSPDLAPSDYQRPWYSGYPWYRRQPSLTTVYKSWSYYTISGKFIYFINPFMRSYLMFILKDASLSQINWKFTKDFIPITVGFKYIQSICFHLSVICIASIIPIKHISWPSVHNKPAFFLIEK